MKYGRLFSILFLLPFSLLHAQQLNLPLNQEYASYKEYQYNTESIHTGFKPLIESKVNCGQCGTNTQDSVKHSWFYRKFFRENLFIIKDTTKKFWATIDPFFNFQGTVDNGDSARKFYQNTRGFIIQGGIGDKFSFESSFLENQADYPYYIKNFIEASTVVPGSGRTKTFGKGGYDFSMSSGYISYSPSKCVNIQLGHDKNFIGDGYRSLLLSDNSFNYPFLKVTTTFGHFQYTQMYAIFMNTYRELSVQTEGLFQRKAATFQYLSWMPISRLEIGVFQGMIWKAADSSNHQSYDFYYFNPVIGVSALKYGLANTNNVLVGSTLKYKVCSNLMVYGQFVVDDNGAVGAVYDKTGYQAGIKFYNNNVEVQVEYNQIRPFTYSAANPEQSYTHYGQALGDPMGANFKEWIGIVNYRISKRFALHLQLNYTTTGLNTSLINAGENVFASDESSTIPQNSILLQGNKATITYADAHVSYLMNPRTNMNIVIGATQRMFKSDLGYLEPSASLIYIGFRTSLTNVYTDF